MKFDTFLASVDDWGKFQKVKYTLICLTYMLPPIMVYTYTFTAAIPNFRCRNPDLISNDGYNTEDNQLFYSRYRPMAKQCEDEQKHLSLKECQRCFIRENQTRSNEELKQCDRYVFDRTHYEKTLVEEVIQTNKTFPCKIRFSSGIQFVIV